MLVYDTYKINSEIPIADVIRMYVGENVEDTRRNIACPSETHTDKHPSAHIYTKSNTCHCFSCGNTYTPISLAIERYPNLSFPDVCKQLIADMGESIYEYSNYAEVEAQQKNEYYEVFPLSENDLLTIGLHNPRPRDVTMTADEYCYFFYGDSATDEDRYYEDGSEITYTVPYAKAVELGYTIDIHKMHTLQGLWKEDKATVEEMLKNHCEEALDKLDLSYEEYKKENLLPDTAEKPVWYLKEEQAIMKVVDKLNVFFTKRAEHNKSIKQSKQQANPQNEITGR